MIFKISSESFALLYYVANAQCPINRKIDRKNVKCKANECTWRAQHRSISSSKIEKSGGYSSEWFSFLFTIESLVRKTRLYPSLRSEIGGEVNAVIVEGVIMIMTVL